MNKIPFTKMNYLLLNSKGKIWEVNHGMSISFFEYVKSQMHFPLVPYFHGRDLNDYKEVYLYLTGLGRCDKEIIGRVVKYFYLDVYNSLKNTNQKEEEFSVDFSCIETLFPKVYIKENLDLNQKIMELNKAYLADSVYLFIMEVK